MRKAIPLMMLLTGFAACSDFGGTGTTTGSTTGTATGTLKTNVFLNAYTNEILPTASTYSIDGAVYVSTTGNDMTGDGSFASPYRTVGFALSIASNGSTIILREGAYDESFAIDQADITIRSMDGELARILTPTSDPAQTVCVRVTVNAIRTRLYRLEIVGGYLDTVLIESRWDDGDPNDQQGVSGILIDNCTIHGAGRDCVRIEANCDTIAVRNSVIFDTGLNATNGLGINCYQSKGVAIQDCRIYNTRLAGIALRGGSSGCVIERTVVSNSSGIGIAVGFDTLPIQFDSVVNPDYYECIDTIVRNCLVTRTVKAGVAMVSSKRARIYNNTLIYTAMSNQSAIYFGSPVQDAAVAGIRPANTGAALRNNLILSLSNTTLPFVAIGYRTDLGGVSGYSGSPVMDYNVYYRSGTNAAFDDDRATLELVNGSFAVWKTHIAGESHSMVTNPSVTVSGHLISNSLCRNAATNLKYVSYDIDRTARSGSIDIGADEY